MYHDIGALFDTYWPACGCCGCVVAIFGGKGQNTGRQAATGLIGNVAVCRLAVIVRIGFGVNAENNPKAGTTPDNCFCAG